MRTFNAHPNPDFRNPLIGKEDPDLERRGQAQELVDLENRIKRKKLMAELRRMEGGGEGPQGLYDKMR